MQRLGLNYCRHLFEMVFIIASLRNYELRKSSQTAELNSFHGDVVPSLGAAFRGFVIAEQSQLSHQPTKSLLHDPAAWQAFEAPRASEYQWP